MERAFACQRSEGHVKRLVILNITAAIAAIRYAKNKRTPYILTHRCEAHTYMMHDGI